MLDWKRDAPKTVKLDGKTADVAAGVVDGKLILQILEVLPGDKVRIDIEGQVTPGR